MQIRPRMVIASLTRGSIPAAPEAPREASQRRFAAEEIGRDVGRKKISTTVYITPEQDARLKVLHARTKVPVAEYIRQGIDLILEKHQDKLPGQAELLLDRPE